MRFTVPEDFTPRKPPPDWEIVSWLTVFPSMNLKRRQQLEQLEVFSLENWLDCNDT